MLILIDFYAENPIVGKTLEACEFNNGEINYSNIKNSYSDNSNTYHTIKGIDTIPLTISAFTGQNLNLDGNIVSINSLTTNLNSNIVNVDVDNYIYNQADNFYRIDSNYYYYYGQTINSTYNVLAQQSTTFTTDLFEIYDNLYTGTTWIKHNEIILGTPPNNFIDTVQGLVKIKPTSRTNTASITFKNNTVDTLTLSVDNFTADCNLLLDVSGNVLLPDVGQVKISGGTSGQVLTTDGANNLSWTTPSSGGLTTSNFVFNEIPVGLINNVNLNYTLAFIPQANTVQVFVNGLLQKPTTDYTVSGSTLSFIAPLQTGDELLVHYIK